jgi:hypothetical protein
MPGKRMETASSGCVTEAGETMKQTGSRRKQRVRAGHTG